MRPLRLLSTLLLLLPPPLHAATPLEVELGKIPGYTGGTSSHAGDYLTSTFCFCAAPPSTPPHRPSEANYLQFEYYNSHQNMTYVLAHLCLADADDQITCIAPRNGDGWAVYNGVDWVGEICRTWYNRVTDWPPFHTTDTLCYKPAHDDQWRQYRMPGPDELRFNKQRRRLDPVGGQGPVLRGREEAEDVCGGLCEGHAGMGVLRGNERAQCHVVGYEDLDDMCEKCA